MKTLYNVDHLPVVVDNNALAIEPGEPHEFTDEQVEAGITGVWSETDPRGRAAVATEPVASPTAEQTTPAAPEKEQQS